MYIRIFAVLAIASLGAVAAFNAAIDPYGFFGTKLIAGVNVLKPEMGFYEKELKAHRVASLRPDGLILGSSASDVGLNPEHPGWSTNTTYNLAIGAPGISLIHQYLLHAMAFNKPEQIVLGLELGMFNPAMQTVKGINPSAFAVTASGERNREYLALNYYANALSLDMLESSLNAFAANRKTPSPVTEYSPAISSTGMMGPKNFPSNQWKPYRQRFQKIIIRNTEYFFAPLDEFRAIDFNSDPTFDYLRQIVRLSCDNQIGLSIVLSPVHAYFIEGKEAAGLTELWERWKKAVVTTASTHKENSDCDSISVWDFSGYNQITTEVIPISRDKAMAPKWYWDTVHYKAEVGDQILNRVFALRNDQELPEFGVRLTPENIDGHIAQTRQHAIQYRKTHVEEVALINETVAKVLNPREE